MNYPKLIAVSGSFEGKEFPVGSTELSVGRDKTNDIRIADRSISRRHCLLRPDGAAFRVVDLESFNGTFVNGAAVTEHPLAHGDRLTLGDISFIFLETADEPPTNGVEFASELNAGSTIRLARQNALYLNSRKFLPALAPDETATRSLAALLDLNVRLGRTRDLETLHAAVFDALFETLPATRGALVLVDETLDRVTHVFGRGAPADAPVAVSRTVAEEVLREKTALLCRDVRGAEAFEHAASLLAATIRSFVCAPLASGDKIAGLLYLDTADAARPFTEEHLQFATAVAGIVSVVLENLRHLERLESENAQLRETIRLEHNMIGESAAMQKIFRFIEKVAPTDATVLVRGESGTGKELVAGAIHENSARRARPFVAINCAVLSENLLESELFGHERGAFTTAVAQKKGKLEIADGGTLFLDEVGELSLTTQAKLLRVLQEREFERVGGTRTIKVDVRLVTATNRELEAEIAQGRFRADLFYRLNVVALTLPPLRERRADIAALAEYFVEKYARKCNRRVAGLSAAARELLVGYDWPGNVRELENAVERAVVLGSTDTILPDDLPETILETTAEKTPVMEYQKAVNEMKKDLIRRTLAQAGGNYAEAARMLGLHPANLHRLIRTLDLKQLLK